MNTSPPIPLPVAGPKLCIGICLYQLEWPVFSGWQWHRVISDVTSHSSLG